MARSIISDKKQCFITGSTMGLQKHHIMFGAYRKKAEQDGLWVWLRFDWHTGQNYSVHQDRQLDLMLKMIAQKKYEQTHSRADWMKRYRKNYLGE